NCADARYAYGTLCEGTPASALTKVHTVSITFVRLLIPQLQITSSPFRMLGNSKNHPSNG
ncbi:hypothetical protein, partial [Aerosakkonema funiforme]|uniref:hypothetical protein n=1 Tax=Aerosakkonema funiforme TaxID=1246630 RepID=UPI001A7ED8B8